jgi:protein-tyrosine phosphatase
MGSFANWITERLATGGALSGSADVDTLKAAGITAVIDCQAEHDDGPLFADSGIAYVWNPTADDGQTKPPEWFARSLAFALAFLSQPRQYVLAHCGAGVNRGPSTAFAVLRALGLTHGEAMLIVTTGRPQAQVRYANDADRAVQALGYTVNTP